MIASKRDTSNIYKGCLAYLRDDITAILPKGQSWVIQYDIKYIIGTEDHYNVHNSPWANPPSYYEIYFGDKYIVPTAYSLMGRRDPTFKIGYLRSWNFSGKDESGKWILLH